MSANSGPGYKTNPMPGDSEIEIRQVFEADDFGEQFTRELKEQAERVYTQVTGNE